MSQPPADSLLAQLDSLQDYVLDELDALDARIADVIKQLAAPDLQIAAAATEKSAA
jgi:hypothetical protein